MAPYFSMVRGRYHFLLSAWPRAVTIFFLLVSMARGRYHFCWSAWARPVSQKELSVLHRGRTGKEGLQATGIAATGGGIREQMQLGEARGAWVP